MVLYPCLVRSGATKWLKVGPVETRMFIVGEYELTIDGKNRLSVPFAVREQLDGERDGHSLYVGPGRERGTLDLYPEKYYKRLRADDPPHDNLSPDTYSYIRFASSQCALLAPDAQGRVLIPDHLLKRSGIGREVVLIAVQEHLELWPREKFRQFESTAWSDYAERRIAALQEMKTVAAALKAEARSAAERSAEQR